MDRELLLELGCEELPASWLPGLTQQIGERVAAELKAQRLTAGAPIETFSTPRRLTVRVARLAERQSDFEELVTGPPVSAAFRPDGQPTPAAAGFATKNGVEVAALERIETPKGTYLAFRKKLRSRAAVDVLPDVLTGVLRGMAYPKMMRWDAQLDDGKGELLVGRPIRWILYLYGGRVVPFTIRRTVQSPGVQEVRSGAVTYGHRFLTTSGRAGRAIKVRTFDEYHSKLLENFVVLEHSERSDKIARELDAKAQRLKGRISAAVRDSVLLHEVPDLVEYPAVVAGTYAPEFLTLPEEVLVTTMVHHQHYFPIEQEDGTLAAAFLAVVNTEPENERTIARNSERVLTARLRDARFFWEADRKIRLVDRLPRLETILFHKKLGSYRQKAERVEALSRWLAEHALGHAEMAADAALAGRLCKADLATDMVREFTELQGVMGGVYGRVEGLPETVWKAIYHHYLPLGIEVDSPPSRAQLGTAAITWAAVSMADKLDTLVGLFAAGEKPTGSRDPYGLRRQAHGLFRILVDLPELTGLNLRPTVGKLVDAAAAMLAQQFPALFDGERVTMATGTGLHVFLTERLRFVLEQRGFDVRNVRAVTQGSLNDISPLEALRKLQVLPEFTETPQFLQLAKAFKRVKNIAKELPDAEAEAAEVQAAGLRGLLTEPAELALFDEIQQRQPVIDGVLALGENYRAAFAEAAAFGPTVDRFFVDVLVMSDNAALRTARLRLMKRLERLVLKLGDISEIVREGD